MGEEQTAADEDADDKKREEQQSYCLALMQRSWHHFYQNFVFGQKEVEIFLQFSLG